MATLEEANLYHAARRNLTWAEAPPEEREAALLRAEDYISAEYEPRLVPDVPAGVMDKAIIIAALVELGQPGFFARVFDPAAPAKILTEVAGVKWEVLKPDVSNFPNPNAPRLSMIDLLLGPYLAGAVLPGLPTAPFMIVV